MSGMGGRPRLEVRSDVGPVLQEILSILSSQSPVGDSMDLIVGHLARLAGFGFCGVLLTDAGREHVHLVGSHAFPADYAQRLGDIFKLPVADEALASAPTRRAFELGRTVVVPDVFEDESFAPWLPLARDYGYRSMVSVPLRVRGEVIGVLNGYSHEPRHYTAAELEIIETLAGHAALAVSIAALLDEQQATITQLRELNDQLERQRSVLERTEDIHQRLTAAVIEGSGFERVAQTLAELIERPVAVLDAQAHLLVSSERGAASGLRELFRRAEVRRALRERVSRTRATVLSGLGPGAATRTMAAQIRIGGELLGYVVVPELDREVGDVDLRAVEQAATVFALEMVKGRVARETEERLRADFLVDLLHGRYESLDRIEERARHHGLNPGEEHRVLVLDLDGWDGYQRRRELTVADASSLRDRLFRAARDMVLKTWPGSLVHAGAEGLIVACLTAGRPDAGNQLARTVGDIRRRVEWLAPELTVSAGIGRPTAAAVEFAESYEGAGQCLRMLRAVGRPGQCLAADEVGVMRLLLDSRRPEELVAFAERVLGPVLEHDSHPGAGLLRTLNCYLENAGDLKACARILSVHPNTVKYRLRRIEELSGLTLRNPNDLLTMSVASLVTRLNGRAEDMLSIRQRRSGPFWRKS
jgi:sugar diacid utilization regulator